MADLPDDLHRLAEEHLTTIHPGTKGEECGALVCKLARSYLALEEQQRLDTARLEKLAECVQSAEQERDEARQQLAEAIHSLDLELAGANEAHAALADVQRENERLKAERVEAVLNWQQADNFAQRQAELLRECADYFDNRADVDDGVPNHEMDLYARITELPVIQARQDIGGQMLIARTEAAEARVKELEAEVLKWQRIRTPTHGPCCTCQKCGEGYDECRCDLDEVADELQQVQAQLRQVSETVREMEAAQGPSTWADRLWALAAGAEEKK